MCDVPLLDERVRMREIDAATDPNDPDHIVVAFIASPPAVRDNAPEDWEYWDGVARTTDGGETWDWAMVPGAPEDPDDPHAGTGPEGLPTGLTSDPVVVFLDDGAFLLSGLAADPDARLFVLRYEEGDLVPDSVAVPARGALAEGLHQVPTPLQYVWNEKQHLRFDPRTGDVYLAWEWRYADLQSYDPTMGTWSFDSDVMFSRSADGGITWTDPVTMDPEDNHYTDHLTTTQPWNGDAVVMRLRDEQLHGFWMDARTGGIWQVISQDAGMTWSAPTHVIDMPRKGPQQVDHGLFQPRGLEVVMDDTGGDRDGTVYIVAAQGPGEDLDIMAFRSEDNGATWTEPVSIIPDDVDDGMDQFHHAAHVRPDGTLGVVFMDRRGGDGWRFWPHVATSRDGGVTWSDVRLSHTSSDPRGMSNAETDPEQPEHPLGGRTRVGEYNGLTHTSDGWFSVWQDGREGTNDVPYSTAYFCRVQA